MFRISGDCSAGGFRVAFGFDGISGKGCLLFFIGYSKMLCPQVLCDFLQLIDTCNLQITEIIIQCYVLISVAGINVVYFAIDIRVEGQPKSIDLISENVDNAQFFLLGNIANRTLAYFAFCVSLIDVSNADQL